MTTTVAIREENAAWSELGDEIVILSLATGSYFGLEGAGNDIWRALAATASLDAVEAALAATYDAPLPKLRGDLAGFLEELGAAGLIRFQNAPQGEQTVSPPLSGAPANRPYAPPRLVAYASVAQLTVGSEKSERKTTQQGSGQKKKRKKKNEED